MEKQNSKIKPAQASWASRRVMTLVGQTISRNRSFARRLRILGELADYVQWLDKELGERGLLSSRELLWQRMSKLMASDRSWIAFEFGVAWGYTTLFWTKRDSSQIIEWHGFDRFTGLPRAWRDVDAGAFDAHGRTPNIKDSRITWHVGDIEDQLAEDLLISSAESNKIVFFDLDLYEPTAFAFQKLLPHLQAGDMLYFDEAYDKDERRVLDELVIPNLKFEVIGATYMALAIRII